MVAHCSAPDPLLHNLYSSSPSSSSLTIISLVSILIFNSCLVESSSSSPGNFSSSSSPLSSYASRVRMPFIAEHPEDVTIGEDEPTTLNCKADGSPNPKIEWYKDGELLRSTGNRMTLSSGSLFFLHVISEKDTGVYWCTASNIAGTAISRKATLSLKSSSSSSSSSSSFVTSTPTHHHSHHRKGSSSSTAAERHVIVKSPPVKPPSDLMLKVFDKHSALLSWSPPRRQTPQHHHGHNKHLNNQIPISGYRVFLRSLETGSETSVEQSNITTDSSTLSVMLNNLSPELTYEVSVSAFNSEGLGPFSTPLLLRTDPMDGVLSRRTQTKDRLNFAKDPLNQPWFFTLIGVTVFLVMSPCILFFLIRYRKYDASKGSKKCANNNGKSSHVVSEPHHQQLHPHHPLSTQHINESNSAFGGVWIDRSCYYGSPGNTDRRRDKMNLTSVQRNTIDSMNLPDHESIYSSIEPDYAEVSDNNFVSFHKSHPFHSSLSAARHPKLLSSTQQQQHHSMSRAQHQQQQQSERPTTPGPYATTNLINIIPNSLYRDLD